MCPHDDFGREIPDPTPVSIPSGVGRPESLTDTIRRMVRNELSQAAQAAGSETFEEANDFDEDADDFVSPYELTEMQEEFLSSTDRDRARVSSDSDDSEGASGDGGRGSSGDGQDSGGGAASKAKGGVRRPPAKPAGVDGGDSAEDSA